MAQIECKYMKVIEAFNHRMFYTCWQWNITGIWIPILRRHALQRALNEPVIEKAAVSIHGHLQPELKTPSGFS